MIRFGIGCVAILGFEAALGEAFTATQTNNFSLGLPHGYVWHDSAPFSSTVLAQWEGHDEKIYWVSDGDSFAGGVRSAPATALSSFMADPFNLAIPYSCSIFALEKGWFVCGDTDTLHPVVYNMNAFDTRQNPELLVELQVHTESIATLKFLSENVLAVGTTGFPGLGSVELYLLTAFSTFSTLAPFAKFSIGGGVNALSFLSDRRLAVGTDDGVELLRVPLSPEGGRTMVMHGPSRGGSLVIP